MSELINLSVRQQLLPPDKLAYELNLIPTPEELSKQTKNKFILIGLLAGIALGLSFAAYYTQKNKKRITD